MNDYFNHSTNVIPSAVTARSSQVNNIAYEIEVGLDKLPTEAEIKRGIVNYATDTGSANTYVVTLTYAPASYVAGMQVLMKVANTNTGGSTINVNGLGAQSILRADGVTALQPGDLPSGGVVELRYNATNFLLVNGNAVGIADTAFLASIGALGTAADKMIYTTAANTAAETPITSFARTLLDDTSATVARATLDVPGLAAGGNFTTLPTYSSNNFFYNNGPGGTFTSDIIVSANVPYIRYYETDGPADAKRLATYMQDGTLTWLLMSDDMLTWSTAFTLTRSGISPGAWNFNGDSFKFNSKTIANLTDAQTWTGEQNLAAALNYFVPSSAVSSAVEFGQTTGGVATSFRFDFNTGSTVADYDVRFTFSGGTGTAAQGDLDIASATLKHNSSAVLTLASGGNITTAPTINSETILTLGNAPVDTVLSSKNASTATATSTGATLLTLDLSTVAVGDIFLTSGQVLFTKGGTAGRVRTYIKKSSGTAAVQFPDGATQGTVMDRPVTASSLEGGAVAGLPMEVTTAGTLVIELHGFSAGSDATSGANTVHMSAIQLYNV